MKYRYSKFTGDDLDDVDLEDLLSRLSDLLLSSGFDSPYGLPYDDDDGPGHSMQSLHDAILEAILNGGMLSDETLEKMLGKDWQQAEDAEERLDDLIRRIIEKLQHQGYLTGSPDSQGTSQPQGREGQGGGQGGPESNVRFEITDKSLDFLGYRALRDLLGSIGKSSLGRHDTREMSTGIEASGAPKAYEFGDTMNIDASSTILNAVRRQQSVGGPARRGRLRGSDGRPGRVSELVRDRPHARLQPQHDPLRRGSLHARQARRAGAREPDPPAVSGRRAPGRAVPRLGRGDSAQPARARARRARTTPTPARACGWRGGSSSGSARTCGRSS